MKKIVVLLIVIIIIGAGVFWFWPKDKEEPVKNEKKMNDMTFSDQKVEDILVSDISLITKNNITTFNAKVTNLTANELGYKNIQVIIKDKDDKEIITLICYFGGLLKPDEKQMISGQTDKDVSEAKTLEFKVNE